jgi:hypothetical protein
MKYLINSCKDFAPHSLKVLIPSLLSCGIEPQDILVIIGGSEKESQKFINMGTFQQLETQINAIDQTSFYVMEAFEHLFEDPYYFYLHDTTFVGPHFNRRIKEVLYIKNYVDVDGTRLLIKSSDFKALACVRGMSSNMGIYNKKYLLHFFRRDPFFQKYRSILCDTSNPNSATNLAIKKEIGFKLEDRMLRCLAEGCMCEKREILGKEDIYGTGNKRVIFRFPEIDLYKTGANTLSDKGYTTFLGCKI